MAGAKQRLQQMAQQQFQVMALQIVEGLDNQLDELRARIIADLRELKARPERLKDLQVTDNDYELMAPKPEIITRKTS